MASMIRSAGQAGVRPDVAVRDDPLRIQYIRAREQDGQSQRDGRCKPARKAYYASQSAAHMARVYDSRPDRNRATWDDMDGGHRKSLWHLGLRTKEATV